MNNIAYHLEIIQQRIRAMEKRYHRAPLSVSLLAASKTQSVEKIKDAILAGQRVFGENYVQESLEKINALADKNIEWHFIGSIQDNKTKKIAEHFAWVHTVDEMKKAKRLNDQRPKELPPLNICIQVNTSAESTKSGIDPNHLLSLTNYCNTLPHLKLRGLMSIPAPKNTFEEQRAECKKLRMLFEELNKQGFKLDTLSMGMSDDLEAAIAEGATLLRIGTAIFGERKK